jgi:hypothetical protein
MAKGEGGNTMQRLAMRDTRADVIWRHLTFALLNAKLDRHNYADDVARLYQERTPKDARSLAFHEHMRGSDPLKVRGANKQLVFRMVDPEGPVRLPVELEEAAVLALPSPFREACLAELAQRYGLLAAPMPPCEAVATITSCGDLARAFGQCLQALASTIGDGHLDPGDATRAPVAVRELEHLIALATGLRAAHVAVSGGHGAPQPATADIHELPRRPR